MMNNTSKLYVGLLGIIGVVIAISIFNSVQEKKERQDFEARASVIKKEEEKKAAEFLALTPAEHLRLARAAFQVEKYGEMDRHLSRISLNDPGAMKLRAEYLAKIQSNANQADKDAKAKRARQKAENKLKSPEIGMDAETLYECSWGIPDHINRTRTALGQTEQWAYEKGSRIKCVYLENGVVTAIQD